MESPLRNRIRESNEKLRTLLQHVRDALAGRRDFTSEEIRAISKPVGEMASIVSQAIDLSAMDLDIAAELKGYTGNLEDLQKTLEQVRFMLLARQAHLVAACSHLETANLWASTLKQTR